MRVGALYVYPVKSCAGIALDAMCVEPLGAAQDRRFAFIDSRGKALTQRELPVLQHIAPRFESDRLVLDLGGLGEVPIPSDAFSEPAIADVWGNAVRCQTAVVAELADFLGAPVRLAMLDKQASRAFVDAEPVLVTSSATLDGLGAGIAMQRFRPNIVLEDVHAGDEASWQELFAASVVLECTSLCERCEVIGEAALAIVSERLDGCFGVYCRIARPGELRVGEVMRARARH